MVTGVSTDGVTQVSEGEVTRVSEPGRAGVLEELSLSQRAVARAREALAEAVRRRDGLVVEAIDVYHHSWKQVGRAIGQGPGAIQRILINYDREPAA